MSVATRIVVVGTALLTGCRCPVLHGGRGSAPVLLVPSSFIAVEVENIESLDGVYYVSESGDLQFSFLGGIRVAGQDERQAGESLASALVSKGCSGDPRVRVAVLDTSLPAIAQSNVSEMAKAVTELVEIAATASRAFSATRPPDMHKVSARPPDDLFERWVDTLLPEPLVHCAHGVQWETVTILIKPQPVGNAPLPELYRTAHVLRAAAYASYHHMRALDLARIQRISYEQAIIATDLSWRRYSYVEVEPSAGTKKAQDGIPSSHVQAWSQIQDILREARRMLELARIRDRDVIGAGDRIAEPDARDEPQDDTRCASP